jgi:phosphoenolpyruvate carboxylase
MTNWNGIDVEAEGTGITKPLSRQINLLGAMLGEVVREQAGDERLELVEHFRRTCKRAIQEDAPEMRDEVAEQIRTLSLSDMQELLHAFTTFFHLTNQAEQQEIIRINRERARESAGDPSSWKQDEAEDKPRPQSITAVVKRLHDEGHSLDDVKHVLDRLDVQPTFTAHPTEARRRTVLGKQQEIAGLLSDLRRPDATPAETEEALDQLYNLISLLYGTDEIRAERPTVSEEVAQGLYFLMGSIWETAPRIYADMRRALERYYDADVDPPAFLRFRSWIGSDRDGNPNVTPDVTRRTIRRQRRAALQRYTEELRDLRNELSFSEQQVEIPERLHHSLFEEEDLGQLPEDERRSYQHEPYRLKLSCMIHRLEGQLRQMDDAPDDTLLAFEYDSDQFERDLDLLHESLLETNFAHVARHGKLARLRDLARTFGFHLAALDVRQHSGVHETTVAALLKRAGIEDDYATLSEDDKQDTLSVALADPRPLLPRGASLPDEAQDMMEVFEVIREAAEVEPHILGSYIISMTHANSDVLEPMLLAKEAGLWRLQDDEVECPLNFVPLFETIEDLDEADERMAALFEHPIYEKQIEARGDFQEIMLGYSDSNKDGGFWMANWALHQGIDRLGRVCRDYDVDFRLFHGRGGTVGRGGGRSGQAIEAMPPASHNGRIRFTEQGEVISFRYALPQIAHRHLEQITGSVLETTAASSSEETDYASDEDAELMDELAGRAMKKYRAMLDDPDWWDWYVQATPIEHISRLPIASRPVSRTSGQSFEFDDLRAIPWVFAWTQPRYIAPGWYGTGAALADLIDEHGDTLRRFYREWPFFQTVLDSVQREMRRARLDIARHYDRLAGEPSYHDTVGDDYERARRAILNVTDQDELLDNSPVLQKSIALRNPYTDVLNLLQVELIRRYREASENERDELRRALFLSINGVAAAMQSTG